MITIPLWLFVVLLILFLVVWAGCFSYVIELGVKHDFFEEGLTLGEHLLKFFVAILSFVFAPFVAIGFSIWDKRN